MNESEVMLARSLDYMNEEQKLKNVIAFCQQQGYTDLEMEFGARLVYLNQAQNDLLKVVKERYERSEQERREADERWEKMIVE